MIRRRDIRYKSFWVRLVCCLAVAFAVANAVHFDLLTAWEALAHDLLLERAAAPYEHATEALEIGLVFYVCLVASFLRFGRPLAMVIFGTAFVALHVTAVVAIGADADLALPAVAPLLGILGSSTFLGTMAWSEERSRRRDLESLETDKQRLIDMLVHDLRKRLSSILSSFSVIEKGMEMKDGRTQDLADTIRASASRMLIQIDDLLAIRKSEEGTLSLRCERFPVGEALRQCVQEHRPAAGLADVTIDVAEGDEAPVYADRHVFGRIMANLLWNAVQHAPGGSRIEVGYSDTESGVTIHVANRGEIIASDRQELLFRAFVSGETDPLREGPQGVGLGLAFCRMAAETHGGSIRLESPWREHGDGVKVSVTFPASNTMQE